MSEFKIVCIADAHLHQHNRLEDKVVALKRVSNYIRKNNVDLFVDLGDTFDVPNPTEEVRIVYANFLRSLSCEIVRIKGNHETRDNKIYAFDSYFPDYNEEEDVDTVISVKGIYQSYRYDCNLVFCNYGHQGGIQQKIKRPEIAHKFKNILFAHLTVNGAKVNDNYTLRLNDGVNPSYFEGYDYVFLGDIHKRQIQDNWRYIGALTKNNFGESENKDGFSVITIDENRNIKEEFIQIPGRYYIKLEMTEESDLIYTDGLEGSIVKVIVSGTSEWFATIDRQAIIKALEKHKPYRLSFEWNTTDTKKREAIEHNQNEMSQLQDYTKSNKVDTELVEDGKEYLKEALINEGEKV